MITAFSVSGVGMMLLILNMNILFATLVLILCGIMNRVIEVHRINLLIGLTADEDVDGKDILENYSSM